MRNGIEILIADAPDREYAYAEIWQDVGLLGEITQEDGEVLLHLYPGRTGASWQMPRSQLARLIHEAHIALVRHDDGDCAFLREDP